MHGHSRSHTHVAMALALMAAVAVLLLVPSHRSVAAAGALVFVLFAVKHLALLGVVGIPAAVAMQWLHSGRNRTQEAVGPHPDADGWIRTGEAEPHRGVLRLEHDVRSVPEPATSARQAMVELDADKRMTLRFLSNVDAVELRDGLRQRYAKRGYSDVAAVDAFLSLLTRPIARGEALVITYDASTQTTRAVLGDVSTTAHGREFMVATWRLWFDDAVPAALVDALLLSFR